VTALVGISLQPDREYLERLASVIHDEAEYVEVAPETLWTTADDGALVPNGYWREFSRFRRETGMPFVAHGVGLSLGTVDPADAARLDAWLARIADDHREFDFGWYTDHLGAAILDGRAITLPVPLPMTDASAAVVRDRLIALQAVVPDVGFENAVFYFLFGRPLDEPDFFRRILTRPRMHLLLDLHNVFTMARNFGFDADLYLERVDLSRVVEIHLSGGSQSDPKWLPSGATMRLDSHDAAVPEEVWGLFERIAPRCANLRGVTVERIEGTVGDDDPPLIREELVRAKRTLRG